MLWQGLLSLQNDFWVTLIHWSWGFEQEIGIKNSFDFS